MFDTEGHVILTPKAFFAAAQSNLADLVSSVCMSGTPSVFPTFKEYDTFRSQVAGSFGVHPRTIVVRGSAHLGFSTSPNPGKAWRPLRNAGGNTPPSDIDIAIVDREYFRRLDEEVREWEGRQRRPKPNQKGAPAWMRRENYRLHNTWSSDVVPPATCVPHARATQHIASSALGAAAGRKISAWAFMDWWSLQRRQEYDIQELLTLVAAGKILTPLSGDLCATGGAAAVSVPGRLTHGA